MVEDCAVLVNTFLKSECVLCWMVRFVTCLVDNYALVELGRLICVHFNDKMNVRAGYLASASKPRCQYIYVNDCQCSLPKLPADARSPVTSLPVSFPDLLTSSHPSRHRHRHPHLSSPHSSAFPYALSTPRQPSHPSHHAARPTQHHTR